MTSRFRRSSVKARKSLSHRSTSSKIASTSELTLDQINKTVRTIQNRRKQRHTKLRESTRQEDETQWWESGHRRGEHEEGTACPVCGRVVAGDTDVVEAHVDSCLAHANIQQEAARRSTPEEEDDLDVDIDGEGILESVTAGVSFRGMLKIITLLSVSKTTTVLGTGFNVRDRSQLDVDDDIDVDGEDDVLFGVAQFTEGDIIQLADRHPDGDAASEGGDVPVEPHASREPPSTTALKDLVADGMLVRRKTDMSDLEQAMDEVIGIGEAEEVERAIEKARRHKNNAALIKALENKLRLVVSILSQAHRSMTTDDLLRCRRGYPQVLYLCAAYALIPTASQPSLQAAGIRVVASAGCAV